MKRSIDWLVVVLGFGLIVAIGSAPGCSCISIGGNKFDFSFGDGLGNGDGFSTACGNNAPGCMVNCVGPTCSPPSQFPLPSDMPPPPNVGADGVGRDPSGYIILDQSKANFDFLWIADDQNYNVGLVSKISTKRRTTPYPNGQYYGEVARYVTFTCKSALIGPGGTVMTNPMASNESIVLGMDYMGLCASGTAGCCAWDRSPLGAGGPSAAVNVYANHPSRTAVDFNGDVWVANRAFGRQGSVTKIANTVSDCIERNGIPGIQTSSDVNGDGIITTDCDGNNLPDNAATVCTAGRAHEFYGLDDECVLFTDNIGQPDAFARPLALGPGATPSSSADAWAGTWRTNATGGGGAFYRVNGTTGKVMTVVPMQTIGGVEPHPYGAAIDSFGILWAPNEGSPNLFYINIAAANPASPSAQGMVASPLNGSFYGIAVDGYKDATGLVQQVWMGGVGQNSIHRYRPSRTAGFGGLGSGTWARVDFTGAPSQGRGVGVDNRSPISYAWVALDGYAGGGPAGAIGRAPTNVADGVTVLTSFYSTNPGQGTLGAGVAIDSDIWGINQATSSATHFSVDAMGNVLNAGSPDQITLDDNPANAAIVKPQPYTYSDFTGFGLRNFTNPHGTYDWTQMGCGPGMRTKWVKIIWDADQTPPVTTVTVRARTADVAANLSAATFTPEYATSPADLLAAPPLMPNPANFIQVEFILRSTDRNQTPKLKSFQVVYECVGIG